MFVRHSTTYMAFTIYSIQYFYLYNIFINLNICTLYVFEPKNLAEPVFQTFSTQKINR